jgi:hypothetical protein
MPPAIASRAVDTGAGSVRMAPLRRLRLGIEVVSALALVVFGLWFVGAGWGEFTNVAAIAALTMVGLVGAVLVIPFTLTTRHWAAAGAAVLSIVTPTGFAYLPNMLMVGVAILEVRLAVLVRAGGQ